MLCEYMYIILFYLKGKHGYDEDHSLWGTFQYCFEDWVPYKVELPRVFEERDIELLKELEKKIQIFVTQYDKENNKIVKFFVNKHAQEKIDLFDNELRNYIHEYYLES